LFSKDPIRCDDSLAAFEEILQTAKQRQVDFILLAGDLFHENKPSRRTLHATIELLRTYCLGDDPVFIEILNDQKEIFKNSFGKANYEDPFQSVSLPIFAIHGNHDDPSREGESALRTKSIIRHFDHIYFTVRRTWGCLSCAGYSLC
jgi:double-strand break repair protein MRE11